MAKRVIKENIRRIPQNTKKGIRKAFKNIRPKLLESARRSMKAPKNGRVYDVYWSTSGRRLKRPRKHKASRIGESPAVLSGRLLRSLRARSASTILFSAGTDYAPYLEGRMKIANVRTHNPGSENRSFLLRAIYDEQKDTVKELQKQIRKNVQTNVNVK
jgi:hypothetical protein